ncbi:PDZ domain-containing protein [Rubripirellula obstinata]|uniref:PDZ domain-containing protein n=1 Tax=Rubripirellula obstinata TaxID=406547 RepID=UPI001F2AAFD8|nr:PDZ domain-containing protein [Rubripirellula obstinata]
MPASTSADDIQYRQEMAAAVRLATQRVLPSVVTVEVIGTSGTVKGEVAQDAPTCGVIVGQDGNAVEILASNIVLRGTAATILVVLPNGSRHAASVVAKDNHRDLVLLKIETDEQVSAVDLPDQSQLPIGSTTIAIGRYGENQSPMISTGILSATGRLDGIAIQTDARVSAAMYGGPLIDLYGNVLGILIPAVAAGGAEDSTSWYDSGIAFAIPADVIAKKLQRLRDGQDINKGLIGIVAGSADANEADTTIAAVRTRSPAEAAGIKAGDTVKSVGGQLVRRHQEIKQALGSLDAGESVAIVVTRDDQEMTFDVTLADSIPPLDPQRLGIVASQSDANVVVDATVAGSPSDDVLLAGDVIKKFGGNDVGNVDRLRRQLITAESDQSIELKVMRDGKLITKTLTPQSIGGPVQEGYPDAWSSDELTDDSMKELTKNWAIAEIKLPDAANVAAILAPKASKPSKDDQPSAQDLGLLVLLLEPGEKDPQKVLESWKFDAASSGVVMVAIASEDASRWQAKEVQVIANFAAAAMKKAPIHSTAVAVASSGSLAKGKVSAADSMAIAVAISQSETFFGVAFGTDTRPPAVRLRENEPATSLQILMPVKDPIDLPEWIPALKRAGYPVVLGGDVDQQVLLRWCRLLQAI